MHRPVSVALFASLVALGACSLINAPDEVKPGGAGGEGGSAAQSSSGSSSMPCATAADCAVDACKVATCEGGLCQIENAGNNTPCDDGKACTENDFCASGVCTAGAPKQCTPSNDCHTSACDEASGGACVETTIADGTACDDGDPCTATSACGAGTCVPGPTCMDGECTTSTCTPQGCMEMPKSMGTACGDTDCSVGQCNNQGQCVITPINQGQPCDDGKFCTTGEFCNNQGQCLGAPTCGPDQPCFLSGCDEATQACTMIPVADDMPCDDGDSCTVGTTCQGGVCGSPSSTINQCIDGDGCCPAGCSLAQDGDCSLTKWSEGTLAWPDQACNPGQSFGGCNTNAQDHADAWCTWVCQQNGYSSGIWTGNKIDGCAGDISMYCGGAIPCSPIFENTCQQGDQTIIEFTCFK